RRADAQVAPVRELVERDQVFAVRVNGVTLSSTQMPDVVRDRNLVHDFPRAEFPFGDGALDEEAGVGEALVVALRVQGPEAHVDFGLLHLVVVEYRDAILIAGEVFGLNRFEHLLEIEGRRDGLQLAAADEVFAVGRDVHAVRTLAARDQVNDAGRFLRVNDLDAPDHLYLAGLNRFLCFLPVHGGNVVAVFLRRSDFEFARSALGVVAGPEGPALARQFARVAEIEVEGWHQNLPADAHLARLRVNGDAGDDAVIFGAVIFERLDGAFGQGHREARGGQHVFGVRRDERAAVQARDVRDGPQNLLRLHVAQVNARDAVVRVVVDEEPAPVVIAFGLAERRVMHVAPRVTAEHLLRFVIKAVARGRVWRIDGDG